jgi:membrane protein DedA with SNARE-associated domain
VHAVFGFLERFGYWVLFANVMLEQLALPLPTIPVFLAMGALAGIGYFSIWGAIGVAVCGAIASDLVWYRLGRSRGHSIISLICRISLEPDSCVSQTKDTFRKLGPYALLFSKFVPGLNATAAPLAGLTRMPLSRFVPFDLAGSAIWSGAYLSLGFLFRNQIEQVADSAGRLGSTLLVAVLCLVAAYIGWKYYQRRRFIRGLRVARVTPGELREMIECGEAVAVVDLRHALEVEYEGVKIPGALSMDLQELELRHLEIPREMDVVLYCS